MENIIVNSLITLIGNQNNVAANSNVPDYISNESFSDILANAVSTDNSNNNTTASEQPQPTTVQNNNQGPYTYQALNSDVRINIGNFSPGFVNDNAIAQSNRNSLALQGYLMQRRDSLLYKSSQTVTTINNTENLSLQTNIG